MTCKSIARNSGNSGRVNISGSELEELSTALAAGFRDGTGTTFSRTYKRMLEEAVAIAIANREQFCTTLESKQASLASARETLADSLAVADRSWAAGRESASVSAQLDELAVDRQSELHTRRLSTRVDAHDLCHHLYGDAEWTYPVLTAVGKQTPPWTRLAGDRCTLVETAIPNSRWDRPQSGDWFRTDTQQLLSRTATTTDSKSA